MEFMNMQSLHPCLPSFLIPTQGTALECLDFRFVTGNWKGPQLVSLSWLQLCLFRMDPSFTLSTSWPSTHQMLLLCLLWVLFSPFASFSSVIRHTFLPSIPTGIMLAVLLACSRLSDSLMGEGWKIRPGLLSGCFLICYGIVKLLVLGRGRKEADASRRGIIMAGWCKLQYFTILSGIKPGSAALQVDSLPAELPGKPCDRHSLSKLMRTYNTV